MGRARQEPDAGRWIFALYLLLIVWVPIPLGSNRPWAWAVLELWVFLLALGWLANIIRGKAAWNPILSDARPLLLCALAWVGYVWFQLLPLPMEILRFLSPEAARWHLAAALPDVSINAGAINAPIAAPLTLDRYATLDAACLSTAYVAFLVLSLVLLDRRDRIRLAAYALVVSGILQATYSTVAIAFADFDAQMHGTFVNKNHYAGYLLLCLSAGIGVLIASLTGARSQSLKQFIRNLIEWMLTRRMVLRLGLLVMVIALVMTRSRMANTAFFVSLLAIGGIGLMLSKRATRSMVILLVSLVALDVVIVGTYFGAQRVVERIVQTTPQTEDRDEVASYAVDMWKDYPVFGAGLGSFRTAFPRYSAHATAASYTHAHNDYLEFAAETGAAGMALLGLMVLLSFLAALRAQYERSDPLMRGISFTAMMAIAALMIHATVEFNFQIPANALTFMLMLAFAWISLHHRSPPSREPADHAAAT